MKANEINLNRFLSQSDTQFFIPVYQRNYDWTTTQCKQLFEDIIEVGSSKEMTAHFIGSIVYIHDDVYQASGVRELSIIDGQQRLTTVTLLYIAIHSFAGETEKKPLQQKINETYLINKFAVESEKLKLRPTENNDIALKYLLRGDKNEEFNTYSRLVENYDFFRTRINEDNLNIILDGLNKLMFVEISLDRDKDDPQRIFESLNSTGLDLSQADLIRNYIMMSLNHKDQMKIYQNYWEIIENQAKIENSNVSKVSDFVRDYLTLVNKKIPNKSKVYSEFKYKYPTSTIEELENNLGHLKKLVKHYNKLLNPYHEPNIQVRRNLDYINRLEVNVSYPFLIQVYDDYENEVVTKEDFIYILQLIQSFAWRRFIIGLPTNALNKIFMTLYSDVDTNNYIESLELALLKKRGSQRFPNDTEVINTLKEKDVYGIKSKNRVYFLERLENYNNREIVQIAGNPEITIEHIFPKNPSKEWDELLMEEDYVKLKETYLNTIANLTLSGNNGPLGNKTFEEKKSMNKDGGEQGYTFSRLWLNRYLASIDRWDLDTLNERFEVIVKRFKEVWKYPKLPLVQDKENETNIMDVEGVTNKKLDYVIFFDQKLVFASFGEMYVSVVKSLFELQPELFFNTKIYEKLQFSKNQDELKRGAPLNDTYYIENRLSNENRISRLKYLLKELEAEDELFLNWN